MWCNYENGTPIIAYSLDVNTGATEQFPSEAVLWLDCLRDFKWPPA
jgi:hypothetical protein